LPQPIGFCMGDSYFLPSRTAHVYAAIYLAGSGT
jgi:hypothetical protein